MNLHRVTNQQIARLGKMGVRFRLTSTYRSVAEQTKLYREWLAGRRVLPVAVPGTSTHNYGLAFDAVAVPPSDTAQLVAAARSIGLVWAGPNDPVHFQILDQTTWSQALRLSPRRPLHALREG